MSETNGAEHDHGKHFKIVINGREYDVTQEVASFDEVVALAFPDQKPDYEYDVTYRKAAGKKHEGTLSPGGTVQVHAGTIFNVTATRKS